MSRLNWWKTSFAVSLMCAATAIASSAQTFTTLHRFDFTNGSTPYAGLTQGTDGNLYGATNGGGVNGGGVVFKISTGSILRTIYSFCSQSGCADGQLPLAAPVQGIDSSFYGTTEDGGTSGLGTVFKVTPAGLLTTLYSFCSQSGCADGELPSASLIEGVDGSFYGTTQGGGANGSMGGTVFKITSSGTLTTLYSFCSQSGCADGEEPYAGLVQASDGNFYGTTDAGGANSGGTVFKITSTGHLTTLYSFCALSSCSDGSTPLGGVIQASDGNLYGTTPFGGANDHGTVFRITLTGALTTLYNFCSQIGCVDGRDPSGGLVEATDGNFYGATGTGGTSEATCPFSIGCGTLFKLAPTGMLTTLYSFCPQSGCNDGDGPGAALIQDTDGNLYGTTELGGDSALCDGRGCGTVFSLSLGLGPLVETQPSFGKVGRIIKILGTNLTGTTRVTFNSTPATFTVEASSVIKATVPAGATTGTVQVVTPGGTLSSNVPFRVAP